MHYQIVIAVKFAGAIRREDERSRRWWFARKRETSIAGFVVTYGVNAGDPAIAISLAQAMVMEKTREVQPMFPDGTGGVIANIELSQITPDAWPEEVRAVAGDMSHDGVYYQSGVAYFQ